MWVVVGGHRETVGIHRKKTTGCPSSNNSKHEQGVQVGVCECVCVCACQADGG